VGIRMVGARMMLGVGVRVTLGLGLGFHVDSLGKISSPVIVCF
jgi:hypothetical protein